MAVHIESVFVAGRLKKLENIKEVIKLKFNIQESMKVKIFIGVYYEWGHDAKVMYAKLSMRKDVKILADGYKKFDGSDLKDRETPGAPGTILINSDIE